MSWLRRRRPQRSHPWPPRDARFATRPLTDEEWMTIASVSHEALAEMRRKFFDPYPDGLGPDQGFTYIGSGRSAKDVYAKQTKAIVDEHMRGVAAGGEPPK
jgi:hypothetical protein